MYSIKPMISTMKPTNPHFAQKRAEIGFESFQTKYRINPAIGIKKHSRPNIHPVESSAS